MGDVVKEYRVRLVLPDYNQINAEVIAVTLERRLMHYDSVAVAVTEVEPS